VIALACDGLAYAHEFIDPQTGEDLQLIHRDVSPENIMVSRGGAVKVLDFGVARVAGTQSPTRAGTLEGKLAYMPREQVIGQNLDLRIDVYGLGAVMYQLLTGHQPCGVHDEVQLIAAILNGPPMPLRERNPTVPPQLAAIVERAMAYDRDQRYSSCRELQAALEPYLLSTGQAMGAAQLGQLVVRVQESGLLSLKLSRGAGGKDVSVSADPASGHASSVASSAREYAARRFQLGEDDPGPTEAGAPPMEPAPTMKLRNPRAPRSCCQRARGDCSR
jgi:eukaryotic-like serine/threonine-protein kinase